MSRLASRFQLIADMGVQARIVRALTDGTAVLVSSREKATVLYEITLLGNKVMLVCNLDSKAVMTVLDPDKFYRSQQGRSRARKYIKGRPEGGEEE
jgi:hypothetical protein